MFKGFKKRVLLERGLRGGLYGLSAGLFAAAIMIMSFLLAKRGEWYFYLVSGGVGAFVAGLTALGYLLLNRVKDKEVAARIDQTYSLQEKASTMLAYQGRNSLLIDKQREDAKIQIKDRNPRKIAIKLALLNIPALLLGAAALTTSVFTDDIVDAFATVQHEDNFDDETDKIIDSIKDYIGKSQASAAFKAKLNEILEQLREDLKGDTSIPSRQAKVNQAKALVDLALDEVNTKEEIGLSLAKQEGFADLGKAIQEADVETVVAELTALSNSAAALVSASGILEQLSEWINALSAALKDSGVAVSDANYATFSDLLAKLRAIRDNVEDKVAAGSMADPSLTNKLVRDSREQIQKAIEEAKDNLSSDLPIEVSNEKLAEDVKKLMDQLVDPSTDQEGDGNEGEGEEGGNNGEATSSGDVGDEGNQETTDSGESGGAEGGEGNGDGDKGEGSGTGPGGQEGEGNGQGQGEGAAGGGGETEYGSSDLVYTGDSGSTEYGDVIGEYQNDAADDAKGTDDDDLEGAIGDYLNELYGDKNR